MPKVEILSSPLFNILVSAFPINILDKVDIPKIDVVNPVGSGDSTVAGIASGLYHHESDADLLKKANVLGMLMPFFDLPLLKKSQRHRSAALSYSFYYG